MVAENIYIHLRLLKISRHWKFGRPEYAAQLGYLEEWGAYTIVS